MNNRPKDAERIRFLDKQVPEKRRLMVERAFAGSCSPRAAIKAHCFICSGMDAEEAKNCSVVLCALYEFNGYRKPADDDAEEKAA